MRPLLSSFIIPVLYSECQIPFRLRRLQYTDFRNDYEFGVAQLLNALGIVQNASAAHARVDSNEKQKTGTARCPLVIPKRFMPDLPQSPVPGRRATPRILD